MSARKANRKRCPTDLLASPAPRLRRRTLLTAAWLGTAAGAGLAIPHAGSDSGRAPGDQAVAAVAARPEAANRPRSLHELLELPDEELEQVDIIELNLAVARQIPECRDLDVRRYQRVVDEWAAWAKHETDRHWYRFERNPGNYKNSRAYFCALMLCTVIGQDFKVGYDLEGFSFEQPEDLFVRGVIDRRKGTCVSLPILHIAIGRRVGYPIRGVMVPGHTFCRWDDPATGERLNIEAANLGGLTDHDDDYYRHWPYELEPRYEERHHALKSLTMREHAGLMVGSLGAYFVAKQEYPAALRWDALAHWLDPANRSAYVVLRGSIERLGPRYLDEDELAGRRPYWLLTPHPSMLTNPTYSRNAAKRLDMQMQSESN